MIVKSFADWLFNVMLWSAIIAGGALTYETFVAPILDGTSALIGLAVVAVLAVLWPRL